MDVTFTRGSGSSITIAPAELERTLGQIDRLPALPAITARLLEVTSDEGGSTRELVDLIESDAALSARVLSVAGRAHLGSRAETVERAVVLLGFDTIRNLVIAVQVVDTLGRCEPESASRFDRDGLWMHNLAVACAARSLAERFGRAAGSSVRPEEAFICGLLHDVGKIAMDACFPKSYARVLDRADTLREPLTQSEQAVMGIDHTQAGARLAANWNLPAMMRECIWLHHQDPASTPSRIQYPAHVRIVQVANRVSRQMRIGRSGNCEDPALGLLAEQMPGLTHAVLEELGASLPIEIETRSELIGRERVSSAKVSYEALAQTNAELAEVNVSLALANRQLEARSRCFDALKRLHSTLGAEPSHEQVVRSGLSVLREVLDGVIAVVGESSARGCCFVASAGEEPGAPAVTCVERGSASGGGGSALVSHEWHPASVLSGALQDHLAASGTAQASWVRQLVFEGTPVGAIVVTGERPRQGDASATALADALATWLGVADTRVTADRLNEELVAMNRRLVESQKAQARARSLSMVSEMAAGAAHEINNPLAVISGRAQMLDRAGLPDDVRKSAGDIARAAQQASDIVNELMEFAKPAAPKIEEFDLGALLDEVRRGWLAGGRLSKQQFALQLSDAGCRCRADASQIRRLFDEVIRNSVEAMTGREEGRIDINCRDDLVDDRVVIAIRDNGCGMEPGVLERAIDPFFSHRPAGRSRGLGLSRAARWAEINGGALRLESRPNEGTTVVIELNGAVAGKQTRPS